MSELRDLTAVFRAIQASLRDLSEHVAAQDANGEKLRESLHDLRNAIATKQIFTDEQEQELTEVHKWMGEFSRKQDATVEAIAALQDSIAAHRREINLRIKDLEEPDRVTQP